MRRIHVFVVSLSLLGALGGRAVTAPPALAQDADLDASRQEVEKIEAMLAEMKPGDRNGAAAVINATNAARKKLDAHPKKGTPEHKALVDRAKAVDAGARTKMTQKPEPPPAGGTGTADPAAAESRAKLDEVEKAIEAMQDGDHDEATRLQGILNNEAGPLISKETKGNRPLYDELTARKSALFKKLTAKANKPKPAAPPPAPAGGSTTGSSGAAPAPEAPVKPGELDWKGEPDTAKFAPVEKQKFDGWKAQFEEIWKKLAAEDGPALAMNAAARKQSYDEAITKIRSPFRNPGSFSARCTPFVQKKEADFAAFFESRLAEGKTALAAGREKSDDALTKAQADADALDAEIKTLKMGDAAAADGLLAKVKAAGDLLETTTAKLNPLYEKTKARFAAMTKRVNSRKAGQADDPTLAIDLSDAPIDGLDERQLSRFTDWKTKFAAKLKEMAAQDDEYFIDKGRQTSYENDLGRLRGGNIDQLPKDSPIHPWAAKKEDEYRDIIKKKAAAGVVKLDSKTLDGLEAALAAAQVKLEGLAGAELVKAEYDLTGVGDSTERGAGSLIDKSTERAKGLTDVIALYRKSLADKIAAAKSALAGAAAEKSDRHKQGLAILARVLAKFDFQEREQAPAFPGGSGNYAPGVFTEEKHRAWVASLKAYEKSIAEAIPEAEKGAALLKDADGETRMLRSPRQLSIREGVDTYLKWLKEKPKESVAEVVSDHIAFLDRFINLGKSTEDPAGIQDEYFRNEKWIAEKVEYMRMAQETLWSKAVVVKEMQGGDPAPLMADVAALQARSDTYKARSTASLAAVVLEKEIEHPKIAEWRKIAEEAMKFSRSKRSNPDTDQVHRYVIWERLTSHESVEWSNLGRRIPIKYDIFQIRCIVKKENGEYWIATKSVVYNYSGWESYEMQQWHIERTSYPWPIPPGSIDK